MKTLLTIITLVTLVNTRAMECKQYEAQVIGKVVTKTILENGECALRVKLWQINEHIMCPLSQGEIESSDIIGRSLCALEADNDFSGIVVNDGQKTFLN